MEGNTRTSIEGNPPGQQRVILQRKEVLGATLMSENIDNGTPAKELPNIEKIKYEILII